MNQLKAEVLKYFTGFVLLSIIIINILFLIYKNFHLTEDFFIVLIFSCFIFHPLTIIDTNYISKKSNTDDNIIIKSWKTLPFIKKCFIIFYFVIIIFTSLYYFLSSKSNSAHEKFLVEAFSIGIFYQWYYSFYSSRQEMIKEYGFVDDYKFLKSLILPKEVLLGMLFTFLTLLIIGIILFIYISIKKYMI